VRYRVSLPPDAESGPVVVDLVELPSGALGATVGGRAVDLDVVRVDKQISARVDGRVIDLTARGDLPELDVTASGLRARVRVQGDRTGLTAPSPSRAFEPKAVRSPMPGRVIRVSVEVGAIVRAGQALVVLEAMKMENEVVAALSGTVLEIHVSPGAAVEANAKLVTLSGSVGPAAQETG
jgi:acetyl/propionyl-CoA carboxylase alpha subunit